MKYTLDKITRIIIAVITIVAILLLINYLRNVLLPFLIGWVIAYLLNPLVNFVQQRMKVKKRGLSIAISVLFVSLIGVSAVYSVVPKIGQELTKTAELISEYTANSPQKIQIPQTLSTLLKEATKDIDFKELLNRENIDSISKKVLPQVWGLLSGTWQVIAAIFIIFIVFLYVIFILLDFDAISKGFIKLIPQKYSKFVIELIEDVEVGMNKYFRGQLAIAAIVGILFAIGFHVIGLPLGITLGLFIGILNIVPYLQTIGLIPIPILALMQCMETGQNYWFILSMCILVFIIVQATQDMLLVPKIMGKAMGLNPAIILLSLSIWGALMGLAGMIIALPFTTILVAYYKRYILHQEVEIFNENTIQTENNKPQIQND